MLQPTKVGKKIRVSFRRKPESKKVKAEKKIPAFAGMTKRLLQRFFIALLVFSFIAGQLIRLDVFGVQFPLLDVAVFLFVVYHVLTKQFSWEKYMSQKWLIVFIVALAMSNIANLPRYNLAENLMGNLYLLRFIVYSGLIGISSAWHATRLQEEINTDRQGCPLCRPPCREAGEASLSLQKIYIIGTIIALIGIFQFVFLPDLRFLQYQNWDDHLNRLTFPYLDPSFTGAILLVFVILSCFQLRGKARLAPTKILTMIIELIAVLLTFSRATWVTAVLVFGIVLWERKRKRIFVIEAVKVVGATLFLGAVIFVFLVKPASYGNRIFRQETILSRGQSWQEAIQIWQKNPLFGVGFNMYKTYQIKNGYFVKNSWENRGESSVENSYIFVLVTSGVLGFAAFSSWIWKMFGGGGGLSGVRGMIMLSIIVGNLFNNVFFYPFILLIIFFLSHRTMEP